MPPPMVTERKADVLFDERVLLPGGLLDSKASDGMIVPDPLFSFIPVAFPIARDDKEFRLLVDGVISELYRSSDIERLHKNYLGELREGSHQLFSTYALP